MEYKESKKLLAKLNDEIHNAIVKRLSEDTGLLIEIDEIFIGASNYDEMFEDLKNIHENGYGLSDVKPASKNDDFSIYVMDEGDEDATTIIYLATIGTNFIK